MYYFNWQTSFMNLVGTMADYEPITNDAKTIAKNLIESIVTDVMMVIMEQTGNNLHRPMNYVVIYYYQRRYLYS